MPQRSAERSAVRVRWELEESALGKQKQRPDTLLLAGRGKQLLPLKPEDHALERFSERAGVEAERSDCFCV